MARIKKNKPRFWCQDCRLVGYRTMEAAQERAGAKQPWPCPNGWGFHFGP